MPLSLSLPFQSTRGQTRTEARDTEKSILAVGIGAQLTREWEEQRADWRWVSRIGEVFFSFGCGKARPGGHVKALKIVARASLQVFPRVLEQ